MDTFWNHWIAWISFGLVVLSLSENSVVEGSLSFNVEPSDIVVVVRRPAVLDCSVSSTSGQVHIEWKHNNQLISIMLDQRRSILSNGSLYLSNIIHSTTAKSDEGFYRCTATVEGVGTIVSRAAKLVVASLAWRGVAPASISLPEGQTARFSCPVVGTPLPAVIWLKNQHILRIDESRMLTLPSGALEIDDVKLSDEGYYSCNATNMEKSLLSTPTRLTVVLDLDSSGKVSAPVFISIPQKSNYAELDGTITLDCAANGIPRPWITWLKDGSTIDMADLDSRYLKLGTGNLQITNVKEGDAGVYQCRAENREDSVDASANVDILVSPYFTKKPTDVYAYKKDDVEFQCAVYGNPQATVFWLKDGEVITDTEYFQVVNGYNLKILGLMESDAGMYQCVGISTAGNIQAAAQLKIIEPGSIPLAKDVPSAPRNPAAVIVSTRFVTLTWREPVKTNGAIFTYSVYYRLQGSNRERIVNTSRSRLEEANIQGLLPDKKYLFRVVAYNQHGPGESSVEIQVETQPEVHVPSPPINVVAIPVSPTSIYVMWDSPQNPNGNIQHYKMFYMQGDSAEEHEISTTGTNFTLNDLEEFTEYSIWVVALNENGPGASTEEVISRTFSNIPSDTPQNVTLEGASSVSIIIRWEPPPKEHLNGVITGYKIRYKKKGRRKGDTVTTDGNRRLYALTGLEKGSEYQIRVAAMTVNGTGPSTEWQTAETYENDLDESQVPDPPSYLKARPMTDSISLNWNPPKNQNIMVRGYTIGWGKGIPDVYSKLVDGKQRYYVIEALEADSEYVISLRAYNQMGDGRPIYETVRTREESTPEPLTPLNPPMGLRAIVLSSSTVVLYWTDETLPKNQVITDNRYYVVRYTPYFHTANPRYKYFNATDLNCMIDDLKPNTQYEYTVKVVKGRRESPWSMIVTNVTQEAAPSSPPRDLIITPVEGHPTAAHIKWQAPKQTNGQITGYVIFYTMDNTKRDRDWVVEAVLGDKTSTHVHHLLSHTTYYFKIQARNNKGYGPLSQIVAFTTKSDGKGVTNTTLYILLGCAAGIVFFLLLGGVYLYCRRRTETQDRSRKGYVKGNLTGGKPGKVDIKPPDLWIHHDQMELKTMDKSAHNQAVAAGVCSSSPIQRVSNEIQNEDKYHSGTGTDKNKTYMASYIVPGGSQSDSCTRKVVVKPKPIMIPVDSQPAKEPIATATALPNGTINEMARRPIYPRTQYNVTRAHVTIDTSAQSPENPYGTHNMYDSIGNPSPLGPSQHVVPNSGNTPANSGAVSSESMKKGHPFKSFSVPAPPTQSAPATPQPLHIGLSPPSTSSPFRKPSKSSLKGKKKHAGNSEGNGCAGIEPSYSTEELNQEMANLEGLMKDLSAITASEFEC